MNCHRGAGKTAIVSVKCLHQICTVSNYEILCLSRNDDAAMQLTGYVQKRLRMVQDHPAIVEDNKHKLVLANGSSITSIPCGDNSPRSYHVNMMVEDEAAFVPLAVYMAARPTVRAKRGRYMILSTPKGKVGHFYDIIANRDGWTKFHIDWTKTSRFTPSDLEKIQRERDEMSEDWFRQEYQCEFLATEGQLFREADIEKATSSVVPQDDLQGLTWENA